MTQKCIDNPLFQHITHSHYHAYDDVAFLPLDESVNEADFQQLGEWILQAQDGVIHKSDFRKLQHRLVKDPRALAYYAEFMLLCASLHTIYSEKHAVLT